MSELYFYTLEELNEFLVDELNINKKYVDNWSLVDAESDGDVTWKGWIHDPEKDVYYSVFFINTCYGDQDFNLNITPYNRKVFEETVVVKKSKYEPIS